MSSAIGWRDAMRAGPVVSLLLGSETPGMPISALTDAQPSLRARLVGSAVTIAVDFGVSSAVGVVSLVNTTLTGAETVRVLLNDSDSSFGTGNLSNTVHFPTNADRTRGAVVCLLPADITARYMRVLLTDVSAGFVDIGNLAAHATIRLRYGQGLGWEEGRLPLGLRDRNDITGAEFRVPGSGAARYARVQLPTLQRDEYGGAFRDMMDDLTAADDVLWIPDVGLDQGELNRRCVFGGLYQPGQEFGVQRREAFTGAAAVRIVERL